jgi:hypothetical protein
MRFVVLLIVAFMSWPAQAKILTCVYDSEAETADERGPNVCSEIPPRQRVITEWCSMVTTTKVEYKQCVADARRERDARRQRRSR